MSRWDALRPERRECKSSWSSRNPVRITAATNDGDEWLVQVTKLQEALENEGEVKTTLERLNKMIKSETDIPAKYLGDAVATLTSNAGSLAPARFELACLILSEKTVLLSNHQVNKCVSSLVSSKDSPRIQCLSRLVLVASQKMPAEDTAHEVVGSTLLPVLEEGNHDISIVLDALLCLLKDPLHASALLAPLTLDVTDQGQEQSVSNPLRKRLLRALQPLLSNTPLHSRETCCACLNVIVKASSPADDIAEINLSLLEAFFVEAIRCAERSGRTKSEALELLRGILKTYPTTGTVFSKLLIGDRHGSVQSNGAACPRCRFQPTSPLLDVLHNANDERLFLPCIQEFLQAMPLHLWLSRRPSAPVLQNVGQRTSDALVRLIRVVQCRVQQQPLRLAAMCPLILVMLSRIPYSDDNNILTHAAIQLLTSTTRVMVSCRRRNPELVRCLVESMGGRTRPQGDLTPMAVPMRLWLLSTTSFDFREYLWRSAELMDDARKDSMQIISAMARTLPRAILLDPECMERFQNVVRDHSMNSSYQVRLDGVVLLEQLLVGRAELEGAQTVDESIALFSYSIARNLLNDEKPQIRTASLNCYEKFLTEDWVMLSTVQVENCCDGVRQHIEPILSKCVRPNDVNREEGEPNAGVRAAACKSVGGICTQYLATSMRHHKMPDSAETSVCKFSDQEVSLFCGSVCDALLVFLGDSNKGVRSTAVFAIGNLAHAVRERASSEPLIPLYLIQPLCMSVHACLCEDTDKVVGNAIRTIGHLISLIYHPPYRESGALKDASSLYGNVLSVLESKVAMTLALASDSRLNQTWKQRSIAKKHGWGASNSLALILDCEDAIQTANLKIAKKSLLSLIQCIRHSGALNEKVSSSATAAIRKIPEDRLSQISDGSGMIGMAFLPCLLQLYQEKKSPGASRARLKSELELLLHHLLRATTIFDACYLLRQDDIDKGSLEFLYDWMVENEMPPKCFESFALALQRKDLMDDVAIQQKFASRALQLCRNSNGSLRYSMDDSILGTTSAQDEYEDEL